MGGFLDMPTAWDFDSGITMMGPVPGNDRDYFSQRQEFIRMPSVPVQDLGLAEDGLDKDKKILENERLISSFQSFFSTFQPLIGKLYSGPIDGLVNNELISAAQTTEKILSEAVNQPKVKGMLWNSSAKTFNTNPNDLKEALNLASKHISEDRKKVVEAAIRTHFLRIFASI